MCSGGLHPVVLRHTKLLLSDTILDGMMYMMYMYMPFRFRLCNYCGGQRASVCIAWPRCLAQVAATRGPSCYNKGLSDSDLPF